LASEDDEVAVQRVHGVAVAGAGTEALGSELDPFEVVDLLQVDLPGVVEVQTRSEQRYFSAVL
jgi:hypothetical protein